MTIGDFDKMPLPELKEQLFRCCGSTAWVEKMITILPVEDMIDLFQYALQVRSDDGQSFFGFGQNTF